MRGERREERGVNESTLGWGDNDLSTLLEKYTVYIRQGTYRTVRTRLCRPFLIYLYYYTYLKESDDTTFKYLASFLQTHVL